MTESSSTIPAALEGPRPSLGATLAQGYRRMWHELPLKFIGITAFMWVFFAAYFHTLRNPDGPVTLMPLTIVDEWVGFAPLALWPYLSLWFYVTLPPGLLTQRRDLVAFGLWIGALCVVGLACFVLWPTAVPRFDIDLELYPAFATLHGLDAPGNACPSLHVATATFTAIWLQRQLAHMPAPAWLRLLNVVWFVAIAWSTLATKQHVLLDLVAGLALGAVFGVLSLRWPLYSMSFPCRPASGPGARSD